MHSDAEAADARWRADLLEACTGDAIRSAYQPIVDTVRGLVVGYEALARFPGFAEQNPQAWFEAARRHGMAVDLEAAALRAAFAERKHLPRNCFLTVNVSPDLLSHPAVRKVWAGQPDLQGVIIEMTEQAPIESYAALEPDLQVLRDAGALLAIDDIGSGYAGLHHLLTIRPAIIKIDRTLISGLDLDEAKRALVQMLGAFAARIDAWVLAEGVERIEELEALLTLGVPLAQGYLLGRPGEPWAILDRDLAGRVIAHRRPTTAVTAGDLTESAPTATSPAAAEVLFTGDPRPGEVVLLDEYHRPVAVLPAESPSSVSATPCLRVNPSTSVQDALARAVTRDRAHRFDPLVLTDDTGRFVGIVRVERLITALLRDLD
jgi:EAL domain-containing protein (putative c-di-GMP-specific phosphodiesterase class I)